MHISRSARRHRYCMYLLEYMMNEREHALRVGSRARVRPRVAGRGGSSSGACRRARMIVSSVEFARSRLCNDSRRRRDGLMQIAQLGGLSKLRSNWWHYSAVFQRARRAPWWCRPRLAHGHAK